MATTEKVLVEKPHNTLNGSIRVGPGNHNPNPRPLAQQSRLQPLDQRGNILYNNTSINLVYVDRLYGKIMNQIILSSTAKSLDFKKVIGKEVDLKDMHMMYKTMIVVANRSLTHENLQKFMMDPNEQFDLVVAEWLYHHMYSG